MNRNSEQFFATNPSVSIGRSRLPLSNSIKLSGLVGRLIPYDVMEVLPGDSHKYKTSKVIRLTTPITPFMDSMFADFYHFFIPNRLLWTHSNNFFGESEGGWIPEVEYELPKIDTPSGGFNVGTIADYLGVPTGVEMTINNALPFRAYAKVCEDWFRSTALQDPLNIPMSDSKQTGSNGDNYINDVANGGMPFKVCKTFDYFTGCLPSPQRGNNVEIPLGNLSGTAPVFGNGKTLALSDGTHFTNLNNYSQNISYENKTFGQAIGTSVNSGTFVGDEIDQLKGLGVPTKEQLGSPLNAEYTGLEAEINIEGGNLISINELRTAFQIQKWLEKLARGGDRYISIIKSFFGVTSPDARLQRSEYLGGSRVPINVNQVVQTNSANSNDSLPLGSTGAYSLTVDSHYDFERSFTEHGFIISCMVIRYEHTYQQGLNKMWNRQTKFDYYWPTFANLGEMAVLEKEIMATGEDSDEDVFGYQEAWAEYRYKPNRISGQMRSQANTGLDSWHLADNYETAPELSSGWIVEDEKNVDRVLAVASTTADQFFADIYIEDDAIRPMPVNSIPGLIDHH